MPNPAPVAYLGKLPCNSWSMAETEYLKALIRRQAPEPFIQGEFRHFKWPAIAEKIERLTVQGFLP